MATLTVYAEASDGRITSSSTTYATARSGSSLVVNTTAAMMVGQRYLSTTYYTYLGYTQYDTSSLSGQEVSAAAEYLYLSGDSTDADYLEEVRAYDWSTTLTTADWVAGANLGDYTLLSSKTVSPSAGYNEFPTSANFIANINTGGFTRLVHSSSRHRNGDVPTASEFVSWLSSEAAGTTSDPKLVITYAPPVPNTVNISGAGDISAAGSSYFPLNFLAEPQATVRAPIATHITVKSPTNSYTAIISPTPTEATKIERIVNIDTGNATVCQAIAEELIGRWGRQQVSVSGVIPLDVRLKFKEKLHIKIPQAGIDEPLTLQRKQHDVFAGTTSIVCGDIILDDNELIARMLQDLINK